MPTPQQTLEAIDRSISHWERMRDNGVTADDQPGHKDCALCGLFFRNGSCDGCPIMEFTKQGYCNGTPYKEALGGLENMFGLALTAVDKARVQPMVDFLVTVRREWAKKHNLPEEGKDG